MNTAYKDPLTHTWSDLQNIHLRQLPINGTDVISFISRHQRSLNLIILENFKIPFSMVQALRLMPSLKLQKFEITHNTPICFKVVAAQHLLPSYINEKDCEEVPDKSAGGREASILAGWLMGQNW